MGSIGKKLTGVLRKVTPKEIAPFLPYIAMMVPGMQGIGTAARYLVPQLLTAAGSARTSGEISPINQALAAFGSYAAGPTSTGISGKHADFQPAKKGPNFLGKAMQDLTLLK